VSSSRSCSSSLRPHQQASQQARQHLHAGQRVADLMGQPRRHLAQCLEAIAKPRLLVHPLEGGEVAEDDGRAAQATRVVANAQQGVADRAGLLARGGRQKADLGAARSLAAVEALRQQGGHLRLAGQHLPAGAAEQLGDRPADTAEHTGGLRAQDGDHALLVDGHHAGAHGRDQPAGGVPIGDGHDFVIGSAAPEPEFRFRNQDLQGRGPARPRARGGNDGAARLRARDPTRPPPPKSRSACLPGPASHWPSAPSPRGSPSPGRCRSCRRSAGG
jgi:hypothetical protein